MTSVLRRNRRRIFLPLLGLLALGIVLLVSSCGGATPVGWSGPAIDQQTVFIGTPHGDLLALKTADGNQLWAKQLVGPSRGGFGCFGPSGASSAIYGTPAISGGNVIATSYNGTVYAFATANGDQKWSYPPKGALGAIVSGPLGVGTNVVFGDSDGKVYSLGTSDGSLKWSFKTDGKVWATPSTDNTVIYAASLDGHVYALKASDGSLQWKTDRMGGIIATPAITPSAIFVGSLDKNFYALDAATGKEKWRFTGGNFFWASPVVSANLLLAANADGTVYALDATSGKLQWKWTEPTGASIGSTPVLMNNGASLVVGSTDGRLNVIDVTNGSTQRDAISIPPQGTSIEGPLAAQGDVVYAHVRSGNTSFIIGYSIKTGGQAFSKELVAAITQTTGTSSSSSVWSNPIFLILIFVLFILIVFLFMNRRGK